MNKKIFVIFVCFLLIITAIPSVISFKNIKMDVTNSLALIRQPAEFERIESVLIRYPFCLPYELIAEMAEDIKVITIVASESEMNFVENLYLDNNVNIDHISYLFAPSDTGWTRDYGPWFVFNKTSFELEVVDFEYNRPRLNDDNILGIQQALY